MEEVESKQLHTPGMIDDEILSMLGKTRLKVALAHVVLLARLDSPFLTGDEVSIDDYSTALEILDVDDYEDFGIDLVYELNTAFRVYDIILPPMEKDAIHNRTQIAYWSPEWVAQVVSMACCACPSLTLDDVLWHLPMTMTLHLMASTIRRNGGETRRPEDMADALKALRAKEEARRKTQAGE